MYGMFNESSNSILQVRLRIVEMMKEQADNTDSFIELCKRVENYVLNGVAIPVTPKDPNESFYNTMNKLIDKMKNDLESSDLNSIIKNKNEEETENDKREKELKSLYEKHKGKETTDGFKVCGYSKEFNCLIGGAFDLSGKIATNISIDDTIITPFTYYTYIPKTYFA